MSLLATIVFGSVSLSAPPSRPPVRESGVVIKSEYARAVSEATEDGFITPTERDGLLQAGMASADVEKLVRFTNKPRYGPPPGIRPAYVMPIRHPLKWKDLHEVMSLIQPSEPQQRFIESAF